MDKSTLVLLVLSCCFICSLAQSSKGCCTPLQWQGFASGFYRNAENAFSEYVYYDFVNKALRIDVVDISTRQDTVYLETIIERYDLGYIYVIDYLESGTTCVYYPTTTQMPEACIPPGGQEFSFTYGVNLQCTAYQFYNGGNVDSTFTVATDGCIPISGVVLASQNDRYGEVELGYYDVTLGISDPFIFNVPSSGCVLTSPPAPQY